MKKYIILFFAFLLVLTSCQKKERGPLVSDNTVPQALKRVSVENLPGAIELNYTLPDDPNILYVVAEYETKDGTKKVGKSSVFGTTILLEGFGNTDPVDISLFTVSHSEVKSDPVVVRALPEAPFIFGAYQSLDAISSFGGVQVSFENTARTEYVLTVLMKDDNGDWKRIDRFFTSDENPVYNVYNLENRPFDFAFFLIDKWQNTSDTLFKTLTPLHEIELDKKLWKKVVLNNDTYLPHYTGNRTLEAIWDGNNQVSWMADENNIFENRLPNWFTFEIGVGAQLSRLKVNLYYNPANDVWLFTRGNPQTFRLWGRMDTPQQDGSWTGWEVIGEYEMIKPSGDPKVGVQSETDHAFGIEGQNFSLPFSGKSYRYLRFETLTTFGGAINPLIGELTLWGQPD